MARAKGGAEALQEPRRADAGNGGTAALRRRTQGRHAARGRERQERPGEQPAPGRVQAHQPVLALAEAQRVADAGLRRRGRPHGQRRVDDEPGAVRRAAQRHVVGHRALPEKRQVEPFQRAAADGGGAAPAQVAAGAARQRGDAHLGEGEQQRARACRGRRQGPAIAAGDVALAGQDRPQQLRQHVRRREDVGVERHQRRVVLAERGQGGEQVVHLLRAHLGRAGDDHPGARRVRGGEAREPRKGRIGAVLHRENDAPSGVVLRGQGGQETLQPGIAAHRHREQHRRRPVRPRLRPAEQAKKERAAERRCHC